MKYADEQQAHAAAHKYSRRESTQADEPCLAQVPAGGSTTITWSMQAVNAGSFGVYVAVISPPPSVSPPTTGKALHIAVAERRTLNPGGILPLALGIPALLGLLTLGLRLRRRTS